MFNSVSAVKPILRGHPPLNVQHSKSKFLPLVLKKNTCIQQTPLLSDMDTLNLTSCSLLLLKTFIKRTLQKGCLFFCLLFNTSVIWVCWHCFKKDTILFYRNFVFVWFCETLHNSITSHCCCILESLYLKYTVLVIVYRNTVFLFMKMLFDPFKAF